MKRVTFLMDDKTNHKITHELQCPICGDWVEYVRFADNQKCNKRYHHGRERDGCQHAPEYASIKDVESGNVKFTLRYDFDTFICPICKFRNVVVGDFTGEPRFGTPYEDYQRSAFANTLQKLTVHMNLTCKHFRAVGRSVHGVVFEQEYTDVKPVSKEKLKKSLKKP